MLAWQPRAVAVTVTRGLVCKDSRKGHEGHAPPGPTQQPCGLFINQESAPNWAHYQLGFSGAAGRC